MVCRGSHLREKPIGTELTSSKLLVVDVIENNSTQTIKIRKAQKTPQKLVAVNIKQNIKVLGLISNAQMTKTIVCAGLTSRSKTSTAKERYQKFKRLLD